MKVLELSHRAASQDSIAARKCFACGGPATSGIGEHIIPKWLQNECRLILESHRASVRLSSPDSTAPRWKIGWTELSSLDKNPVLQSTQHGTVKFRA
jgi:hypothetical protein